MQNLVKGWYAVEGNGAHTRVQVKFSEHGVKWLVLAYANLAIEIG